MVAGRTGYLKDTGLRFEDLQRMGGLRIETDSIKENHHSLSSLPRRTLAG